MNGDLTFDGTDGKWISTERYKNERTNERTNERARLFSLSSQIVCALLLDLGADACAADRHGRTALEMAGDGVREHLARHPAVRRAGIDALGANLKAKHLARAAQAQREREEKEGGGLRSRSSGSQNAKAVAGAEHQWGSILDFIKDEAKPKPGQSLSERHGCRLFNSTAEAAAAPKPSAKAVARNAAKKKAAAGAAGKKGGAATNKKGGKK